MAQACCAGLSDTPRKGSADDEGILGKPILRNGSRLNSKFTVASQMTAWRWDMQREHSSEVKVAIERIQSHRPSGTRCAQGTSIHEHIQR